MTRVDRIVDSVHAMLQAGRYKLGERLPSVRQAAAVFGVSKNTMAEAYDRLVADGLLEARIGSGYYVAHLHLTQAGPVAQPHFVEALDTVSLLREQLDQLHHVRPGDGRPPPSWMEGSELRRHFALFKEPGPEGVDFGYGPAQGFGPLRERLRVALLDRSITAHPEGLLLTHGANHAFDLIIRHLLEPGDTVFIDDPGYYPLFGKLALAKVHVVGVARGPDGPDPEDLEAKLALYRPKLFFTQSHAHNPTGTSLSLAGAYLLLQSAARVGFRIVEDDAFADILSPTLPRLAALDQLERVLYVGTFSKTLSASLRSGFIAADPVTVRALSDLKLITTVNTSDFVERFIFRLIHGGQYLRHLRRLRARLQEAYDRAQTELGALGLNITATKTPGFYLWVELPEHIDEIALCRAAAAESIFLAPGHVFRPNRDPRRKAATRVNVAHCADPRFLEFFRRALAAAPKAD